MAPIAHATSLDEQIAELTQQANSQQSQANQLRAQSDTLANKLASINNQAAALATQMSLNRAKQQRILSQIEDAKAQLVQKKELLDENVRTIYQQSQISPLEMLAASKSLSEYVDRQQYLDRIKDHVQEAAADIQNLKAELEKQQVAVENLINQQSDLQRALAIQRSEAATILEQTRGEESRYVSMAKANEEQANVLKARQAAILAATFGGSANGGAACGGGYPGKWCNIPRDTAVDNWGMYNRECVSYTAFRVAASGRYMPYWGGRGNANQWPANARAAGIPVDGNPRVGDVAVTMAEPYGHVMYVERVNGNGTIFVSQYNYGNNGEYSTMTISSDDLQFIHF
ncbi:MAG TPA: CHAP domain-containing protein [Candidatus Saccharimonadia bacterium]